MINTKETETYICTCVYLDAYTIVMCKFGCLYYFITSIILPFFKCYAELVIAQFLKHFSLYSWLN